ncbi:DUF1642 domain-containing protein [Enterococcus sp. S86.2]|uniref:DUF1642 domain-containing protein n=1 Tax=Enterococcus sp. S86.2 TaxID=3031299 RepID=UPI0026EDCA3F|nr:DUF1642 domain-containing protein [Enterococcus sp. S86.2]
MNKQELIEKIEARNVCDLAVSDSFKNGFNTMKGIAVDLASELDEPVKPEVTQFVADWYEQHKDILDYSIWEACVNSIADYDDLEGTTGNEFYDWLINAGGKDGEHERITLLVHMKDGYTVKEPKWVVKFEDAGCEFYFTWWSNIYKTNDNPLSPDGHTDKTDTTVFKFADKAKAEAVAVLVEGSVEEV